jgi:hypothetical protein
LLITPKDISPLPQPNKKVSNLERRTSVTLIAGSCGHLINVPGERYITHHEEGEIARRKDITAKKMKGV